MKHLQTFERYFDLNDPAGQQPTYNLIYEFGKPKAIHCNICDMTSYNQNDIEQKYCANCDMFHEADVHETPEVHNAKIDDTFEEEEEAEPDDEIEGDDLDKDQSEEEEEFDDEDLEDEDGSVSMMIEDDLKSNFRSWENDHNTQEDFEELCMIMSERHPDLEPDTIAEICASWIGFDLGVVENFKTLKTFEDFASDMDPDNIDHEDMQHWADSEKLKDVNKTTGTFEGDPIELSSSDVNDVPEKDHVVTEADNEILNNYFKEQDGEDYTPFNVTGKTLAEAAVDICYDEDFKDEWLQHMICALFPEKYEGI